MIYSHVICFGQLALSKRDKTKELEQCRAIGLTFPCNSTSRENLLGGHEKHAAELQHISANSQPTPGKDQRKKAETFDFQTQVLNMYQATEF